MTAAVYAVMGFVVGALLVLAMLEEHPDCNVSWRPEMEIVREHLGVKDE